MIQYHNFPYTYLCDSVYPIHVIPYHNGSITGDAVTSRKGRKATLKIVHRFHFSSSLKRMSVISAFVPAQSSGHTHLVTVKGAPEVLKEMVRNGDLNL